MNEHIIVEFHKSDEWGKCSRCGKWTPFFIRTGPHNHQWTPHCKSHLYAVRVPKGTRP